MAETKLHHADDSKPGITRKKAGHGWGYYRPDNTRITDRDEIDRLNSIALPPAYRQAWFCPDPKGHIQATGRDAKGRKQYRYHPLFREVRESVKFEHVMEFARVLPMIRKKVSEHMSLRGLPRELA